METQLLKLDPPYNIICSNGRFAKHIATLIVVDQEEIELQPGRWKYVSKSYPVVDYGDGSPEGDVWMFSEVRDCRVVSREGENGRPYSIPIVWFCQLRKFNKSVDIIKVDDAFYPLNPGVLRFCLDRYDITVRPPGDDLYEVELSFREVDNDFVEVESVGGVLYFNSSFLRDEEDSREAAIQDILKWWNDYLEMAKPGLHEGQVAEIVFRTENEQYDEFVADLNWEIDHARQK